MRIKQSSTLVGSGESNQYRSIALAAAELTWIQSLLSELGCTSSSPPTIWCDNLGATYFLQAWRRCPIYYALLQPMTTLPWLSAFMSWIELYNSYYSWVGRKKGQDSCFCLAKCQLEQSNQ